MRSELQLSIHALEDARVIVDEKDKRQEEKNAEVMKLKADFKVSLSLPPHSHRPLDLHTLTHLYLYTLISRQRSRRGWRRRSC
jgi:hypothetical protein